MSKHKLLLADDSVTIQKVVNLTFADEGIEVITVGDGNSAMEKFVEATPDLVMVDVNMPGVDGYRICEMIKQDEETKHVPVILLVGSFEPFDEDEARRVGANDYLTKPFQSIRQLVNKVTVLLNKSNGSDVVVPPLDHIQPVQETPVYQNIEQVQPIETPVWAETEEISEPLGDAGMDDEMIQANQIGSLPVDDVQKLESGNEFEFGSLQNQLRNPFYEPSNQQNIERDEDFGKTQPYSAEEFKELTSIPAEFDETGQTSQNYNTERISAEERAIALENQMVSDFETEAEQTASDFQSRENVVREFSGETSAPQPFGEEEMFMPEEIPAENQIPVEEIPQEKDFAIEELQQTSDYPADEAADYYDTSSQSDPVSEEIYDAPEDAETADSIGSEFYSRPETMNAQDISDSFNSTNSFNSTKSFEIISTEEDKTEFSPVGESSAETPFEDEQTIQPSDTYSDPEIDEAETSPYNFEEPETVSQQPTYFEEDREVSDEWQINAEDEVQEENQFAADSSQTFPIERPVVSDQDFEITEQADLQESAESTESFEESETDTEPDYPKSITFSEPESYFSQQNESFEPEFPSLQAEQITEEEEITTPTIEIPTAFPTIEEEIQIPEEITEEEEQSPAEDFSATEETSSLEETVFLEEQAPAEEVTSIEEQTPIEEQDQAEETVLEDINLIEEPVTEKEVSPIIHEEEPPLEVEPKKEQPTAEPQFNSLVSNKEKSEAVESVIVSEFARHSISLSSEAVETIASRIADKISEKIVQQMANDVVGNLADLIVERMERKKQE